MIFQLTSALIKDLVVFLKKEKMFFTLSHEERKKKAPFLSAMIGDMSEQEFLDDLALTLKALRGAARVSESKLLQALGRYFVLDFPAVFDQLNRSFYQLSPEDQRQRMNELIPESGHFFDALRYHLALESVQEITEEIVNFLRSVFESPHVLVQSPVDCSPQTKSEIRQFFAKQYPQSFVAFSLNPQLIGGIRFFVDGKVEDFSWFSKIQSLHRLSALV